MDYWIENRTELVEAKAAYLEKAQSYAFEASAQLARSLYQGLLDKHNKMESEKTQVE